MMIKKIEVTTDDVVCLPTPSAPPSTCRPRPRSWLFFAESASNEAWPCCSSPTTWPRSPAGGGRRRRRARSPRPSSCPPRRPRGCGPARAWIGRGGPAPATDRPGPGGAARRSPPPPPGWPGRRGYGETGTVRPGARGSVLETELGGDDDLITQAYPQGKNIAQHYFKSRPGYLFSTLFGATLNLFDQYIS